MSKFICLVGLLLCALQAAAQPLSMAVFYGSHLPLDELQAFDVAVVEPHNVTVAEFSAIKHTQLFAYVSVGEVDKHRAYLADIPKAWQLGINPNWDSVVLDQSQAAWPAFFAQRIVAPLWQQGYRGFFLDTLDSYQLLAKTDAQRGLQEAGLVALIHELRLRFPGIKLMFNRGFEILPQVHDEVYAVAIESLFQKWNGEKQLYEEVSKPDRDWLMSKINTLKDSYHLPVLIIDYVAPKQRELARQTAQRISDLGLIPWVSNSALDMLGVGAIEVMPRKILFLHNGANNEFELFDTYAVRYGTMPLNYLGYSVEYQDARKLLPADVLTGRYAGVVMWLDKTPTTEKADLLAWLAQQRDAGMPLLMLGEMSFLVSDERASQFGFRGTDVATRSALLHIRERDDIAKFEAEPALDRTAFYPLQVTDSLPLLTIENDQHATQQAIAITPWGGYALSPLIFLPNTKGAASDNSRWVVNPIELMRRALKLPDMPVPDLTTLSGRRMLMAHMDGDGFASHAEFAASPYAGQVMLDRIFKKFPMPITASIVQAEIAKNGLYAAHSPELEKIARDIFALPNIEIASHSYSHPFSWQQNAPRRKSWDQNKVGIDDSEGWYRMLIPGYDFSLDYEITGSIQYIQSQLAPAGKKAQVLLWTGDCNPGIDALHIAAKDSLLTMNGGDTLITRRAPSYSLVAPIGVQKNDYFQVYAPNQNENMYTNEWTGPFYGFERAIETFQLTDEPYRLKPMDVYFHTYSASKPASLQALDKVFSWALSQSNTPVYVSEYVRMAQEFNHLVVARSAIGWQISGANNLRQVRMPAAMGFPDLTQSIGVAGFNQHAGNTYIHLGENRNVFKTQSAPVAIPYLVSANAAITQVQRDGKNLQLSLRGDMPLEFILAHAEGCQVTADKRVLKVINTQLGLQEFATKTNVISDLQINCR